MRRALLDLLIPAVCPACDGPRAEGERLLCDTCRRGLEPGPRVAGIESAVAYRGTGRRLLHRFKFEGRSDALDVLLETLAERVSSFEFDAVVGIPRHPDRIRREGSDPVHTLGRRLAKRVGRPLIDGALVRTHPTRPQSELRPDERRRNVRGSFRVRGETLRGRGVLLLDDVVTTGATLESAAATLRAEGRLRELTCVALAGTPSAVDLFLADSEALARTRAIPYPSRARVRYKAPTGARPGEELLVAETIRIKGATALKHQANLGEEVGEVEFEQGAELQVLHTFGDAWLVKDDEGRLFNVKKELAEEA